MVVPLSTSNLSIFVPVTEALEELKEDLVFCHLTLLHLGVELGVVNSSEISSFDTAVTILVEFEESLVGDCLSLRVQSSLLMAVKFDKKLTLIPTRNSSKSRTPSPFLSK